MSKIKKKLEALKNNPKADWQMADLKSIADWHRIKTKHKGTSHVMFYDFSGKKLVIPAHKPIKEVYIKMFIKMIGEIDV